MESTLNELIDKTLKHLDLLGLTAGTLKSYRTCMKQHEINQTLYKINRTTTKEKEILQFFPLL